MDIVADCRRRLSPHCVVVAQPSNREARCAEVIPSGAVHARRARSSRARSRCVDRPVSGLLLLGGLLIASFALPAAAAQIDIIGPAGSGSFGARVTVLPNGNVVVTDPNGPASNVGAVYLYTPKGILISVVTGSSPDDHVGSGGITVLKNGNFLVLSPLWHNGGAAGAGAVTWINGNTGLFGVVSVDNSLVGTTANDAVGSVNLVFALANGNYVVNSFFWDNGAVVDAGATTWGNGSTGVSGAISADNSLVGTSAGDFVGSGGVIELGNGNYVVPSPSWSNGAQVAVGAVTWVNGKSGISGVVSISNSLCGAFSNDHAGNGGVVALANGHYVVDSPDFHLPRNSANGAVTWANGATGRTGTIQPGNSLYGSTSGDAVGSRGVIALSNGNYVVCSPFWHNGPAAGAGAATWANGSTGVAGAVSVANSLYGATADDRICGGGTTALSNGNYVVISQNWHNGPVVNAGAATWADGGGSTAAVVTTGNSLVGSTAEDLVGTFGVIALSNGNYVVRSPGWDSGAIVDAGAATWGDGSTGTAGTLSAANSLVGSTAHDAIGYFCVIALANGNYVVCSPFWSNGTAANSGAVTWADGTIGRSGVVSASNSLIGTTSGDSVGIGGVTALSDGNYVIVSPSWNNGAATEAGAVTWASGSVGISGIVSGINSLIGGSALDSIGETGVLAVANGNYVVLSRLWNNGGIARAGAVTWIGGSAPLTGLISPANSLVGTAADDQVGAGGGSSFSDGNYAIRSPFWNNGAIALAGAVTLARSDSPLDGTSLGTNSVLGTATGGNTMVYSYDAARHQLAVGRPASNIVSLFTLPVPDRIFADEFE